MSRSGFVAGLVIFVLGVLAGTAGAQIVTVPPDLAPGAGYRLMFVTSGVRNGTSTNVADYNAFVTSAANAVPALAALGTTWAAFVQTATVTAEDNTGTNPQFVMGTPTNIGVPIYRLDGARVANDNPYFAGMAFPIAEITITELGTFVPTTVRQPDGSAQKWVWTGRAAPSSAMGTASPVAGWATGGGGNSWYGIAISPNTNNHTLYAVSGILHVPGATGVPAVPWTGLVLLAASVCAVIAVSLARRRST